MNRRTLIAIALMVVVMVGPTLLVKRPAPSLAPAPSPAATIGAPDTGAVVHPTTVPSPAPVAVPAVTHPAASAAAADTVTVRSGLYEASISTLGARLIGFELLRYRSAAAGDTGATAEVVRAADALFGQRVIAGGDTIDLASVPFTPSATEVRVEGATTVTFTGRAGDHPVTLAYTFSPDDYRIMVRGTVGGLPATGGLLLLDLGHGIRNTEADSTRNAADFGLVVKGVGKDPAALPFRKLDMGERRVEPGPFTWAAVKSKYFVLGVFAGDSSARWTAAEMVRQDSTKLPRFAGMQLSLPVAASGAFGWHAYAGPMEYPRLSALGDSFDDVNPYGWPGFRTVMRPFAIGFRWLMVWMHTHLGLSYGMVLILFGLLVRLVLWPLNQKAMRSAMQMQAIQPELQALQARYKNDPQRMQQETFRIYREAGVNPLGGCWPMLLPMPILLALFFVLQGTIEIRGVAFLWFPDLARTDPFYIIPLISGLSMFALSRIGQRGIPANPQTQLFTYMMPVMMTIFGFSFPAGLNLYYAASNIASIPQQWMLSQERLKRQAGGPAVTVGTKK